jgi:hypothetical protein
MSDLTCSYPGCERHPSKGDTILRISATGPGRKFVGRCAEHYGPGGREQAASDEMAAAEAMSRGTVIGHNKETA